jgi:hypothetical protein
MIDSHALVGSCAQVGARVHVSAAAQIGGVIEPVGALPVIIEDDVLIGGNTGIYEGAIVRTRAVVAAGTVLTGSTPVYDLVRGEIIKPAADRPLVVPEGAVVVPGGRAVTAGKGVEWGLSLATPVIVKYRDSATPAGAGSVDPVDIVTLTRSLVDIDSTTGREGECGRWLADYLRGHGWSVHEQRVDDTRFNVIAEVLGGQAAPRTPHSAPRVTFSTHFDCVPSFFSSRVEGDKLFGRGSCDAKGILAAQVSAAEQLRRDGEPRVGLVFVVGEERGSDGARAANEAARADGVRFLINGEPTDNRLGLATRGILRKLRASGRAVLVVSGAWRSAIDVDRRADRAPIDPAARRSGAGTDPLHRRPDQRRRRPQRRLGIGGGGGHVQDDERCRGGAKGGGAARAARRDRARPRSTAGEDEGRPGLRHRGLPVYDRHTLPASLGRAAVVRSRIHPPRAHRR